MAAKKKNNARGQNALKQKRETEQTRYERKKKESEKKEELLRRKEIAKFHKKAEAGKGKVSKEVQLRDLRESQKKWKDHSTNYHNNRKDNVNPEVIPNMPSIIQENIYCTLFEESDNEGVDDFILPDPMEEESSSQCADNEYTSLRIADVMPSYNAPSNLENNHHDAKLLRMFKSRRVEREKILDAIVLEKNYDAIDLFFRSIAGSVKVLSADLINEAKVKVLQMVTDLEKRNSAKSSDPPSENLASSQ